MNKRILGPPCNDSLGFAFGYRSGSQFWNRPLAERLSHLLVTMHSPPWYYRWLNRIPSHNQMKRAILKFSAIRPVTINSFRLVKGAPPEKHASSIARTKAAGSRV